MVAGKLFTEHRLGSIGVAKNRIALAPLTRARATIDGGVVGPHHAEYYKQRSSAGLLISEATNISEQARGWVGAPGIYTDEQVRAWKQVTNAVHEAGSLIVLQLWHTGRSSHSDFHNGELPVSASAIKAEGDGVYVPEGVKKPFEAPRPLTVPEIPGIVRSFVTAAKNALEAGFDGVEIHGANGYIIDQFLQSKTNKRTDQYGGSIENRLRFLKEILEAMIEEIPPSKIGIRFSPNGVLYGMGSEDYVETFTAAIKLCAEKGLAFVHVMDGVGLGFHQLGDRFTLAMARKIVAEVQGSDTITSIIGNAGHTKESGEQEIAAGHADLIAYGRPFIANPDLPLRFAKNIPLTEVEGMDHWYAFGVKDRTQGYTTFKPAAELAA